MIMNYENSVNDCIVTILAPNKEGMSVRTENIGTRSCTPMINFDLTASVYSFSILCASFPLTRLRMQNMISWYSIRESTSITIKHSSH